MNFRLVGKRSVDYVYLVDRLYAVQPTTPATLYVDIEAHSNRLHVAFNHSEPRTRHPHIGDHP